eukprot:3716791-Pyramimonas_sp.AAC.1
MSNSRLRAQLLTINPPVQPPLVFVVACVVEGDPTYVCECWHSYYAQRNIVGCLLSQVQPRLSALAPRRLCADLVRRALLDSPA